MTRQPFRFSLFFLICLSIPLTTTAQVVDIPDPNLRAAIEDWLGEDPGATITVADMENLTILSARNANISDLTGLEHATNLTLLDLGDELVDERFINSNSISDFSPLAELTNLTGLWLSNNGIADISPLAGLTNLESLGLSYNSITDISPIAGLTNLESLGLSYNSITDISPLEGLTNLETLNLGYNGIADISPLEGLTNLTRLGLSNNALAAISPLEGLTNLTILWLSNNALADISPLAGLTNLTELWLGNSSISDISPLAGLTNLTELWLWDNSISDISPLAGLTNLTKLWLWGNPLNDAAINTHIPTLQSRGVRVIFDDIIAQPEDSGETVDIPDPNLRAAIEDHLGKAPGAIITVADMATLTELLAPNANISNLTGIEHAINLTLLYLGDEIVEEELINSNSISDLSPLAGLTNLTGLWLSSNSISDISPIAGLTNLTELWLSANSISDISAVTGLTNLTELWLHTNPISDISPIAGLTNLTQLVFEQNSISDISPIAGLTNLTELWLSVNSISDISAVTGLTNLTELWLHGNSISDLSPLVGNTGLGNGDFVNVKENFLNAPAINTHIPALQSRGVTVEFDGIVVRPEDIAQTVDIPDPNLRAAIAENRGKASDATITLADMVVLIQLDARSANITDLTGLERATNLMRLYLNEKYVQAEDRYINTNSVADLSPLAGLTNLTLLWLNDNSITDISPLNGLTNLTHLGLYNNSISDISPLAGLTQLIYLDLEDNSIADISAVAGLINLEHLDLWNNSISDISPLTGLTNLTELDLWNNAVSDISPLAGLTQLIYLDIGDNSISDISPLVENTGVGNQDYVDVTGNPLNALSINTHIPTLQSRGVELYFDDTIAQPADVNSDGVVNIFDLVSVASQFGKQGQNLAADVNSDGSVNILDLVLVAGLFGEGAAAPSAQPQAAEILSAAAVRQWLTDAKALAITDPIMRQGVIVLEQLLASLTPTETQLLANYPNPFNPETWIPYRLAEDAFVTLTIYDQSGHIVRTVDVGHQPAAAYESRSQAIYWDGRNQIGEQVASGVYFYHLSAGDFSATRKMLILK